MKNIVFVSYYFGDDSPVGVGALRIADAMIDYGYRLYVITATSYNSNNDRLIIEVVSNTPRVPSKYSFLFSNMVGKELYYFSWEQKAKRVIYRIIQNHNIHGIYTRSSPICVCPVGIYGKKHFHLPLIMHFTDPIPAPEGWAPNLSYRKRMIRQMRDYVNEADILSFGNSRMISYQEQLLSIPLKNRAFVSPDPATGLFVRLAPNKRKTRLVKLVFLGNIYGNRNPTHLFNALSSITEVSFRFIIYGISFQSVPSYVEFRSRTNNVERALQEADILVDIDGDDQIPVFVSSKLKDYLAVNRPILSITPPDSPSRDLLKGMKTVEVSNNTPCDIKRSIIKLIESEYSEKNYEERIPVVESFSANRIVGEIAYRFNTIINN